MKNFLFKASMPYCVNIENKRIIVRNREYKILFEGLFRLPIPLPYKVFNHIHEDIAGYCQPGEFSINGGRFFLYYDSPEGESEKGIKLTELKQYFGRLAHLLKLCDGLDYLPEDNLLLSCHIEPNIYVKDLEERIKEKDAQIARLLGVIEKMSAKG